MGLACAFRLAREGLPVVLVDRDAPGRATSFGNAGHIATESVFPLASPQVVRGALRYLLDRESPLRIRPGYALSILPWLARFAWAARGSCYARGVAALTSLQKTAREDFAELLSAAGAPQLVHMEGHLVLVERAASVDAAAQEAESLRKHGVASEWLSSAHVRTLVPELEAPIEGAWHFPGTGHVDDPYAVSRALEGAFRAAGGEVVEAEVIDAQADRGTFAAWTREGVAIEGTHGVVSCGAWSKPLAARLGYAVPLDAERGYHVTLPHAFPRFRLPVASFERRVIMTPMTVGLRMTGTVEFGGLALPPDPNRFAMLQRHLRALVPALPTEGMSTWMGYRPSLPDHLPVLGRAPDGRDVFFAFGHQHLGLTLSGVTARLIADEVMGRPRSIDLDAFSPARFQ